MNLFDTKFLSLRAVKREGKPDWVYVHRPNAKNGVVIIPVIKEKNKEESVLFLITKRPPLIAENKAEFCVELPAGLVGDENEKESVEEAVKKELFEETGLVSSDIKICAENVSSSAGLTSETFVIAKVLITDSLVKQTPIDDGGVIIKRIRVRKSEIEKFLTESEKQGCSISSQALAALFYLKF